MNLLKLVATVGSFTGLSRVTGLAREILMSHMLGATVVTDAFIVAFKLPNFFRRFFAEGAFNAAFVPEFAGCLEKEGKNQAIYLAEQVFNFLLWFLLIFVLIVELFIPFLLWVIAPGFANTPLKEELAINFTRITFPYILFISLSAMLTGVLNSINKFALGAATPILLNIFMIIAMIFFHSAGGISLSWAVFIAGISQFLCLYLAVYKSGYKIYLKIPKLSSEVKKIIKLMIPGIIGAGVMQINIFIDLLLASYLPDGTLSYLYYADRLNQLPLSMFGVAIGTVMLPSLSKLIRQNNFASAYQQQNKAISLALQLSIPAMTGLLVTAEPLIHLIFGHGKFTAQDVAATAPTLMAFALGMPAYVIGKVLTTTFFANQDTKTPLKVACIAIAINLLCNLLLIPHFQHVGMALATATAAWVQMLILGYRLHTLNLLKINKNLLQQLLKTIIFSLIMGCFVKWLYQSIQMRLPTNELKFEVLLTLIIIIGGLTVYSGLLAIDYFYIKYKKHF